MVSATLLPCATGQLTQLHTRQQSVASVSGRCLQHSLSGGTPSCCWQPRVWSPLSDAACRRAVSAAGVRQRAVLDFTPSERQVPLFSCVEDVMTKTNIITCKPDTTVDDALELLVEKRITGMPVLDDKEQVVGVVSDFDMLSLDGISGKMRATGMFPDTHTEWSAFFEVQKLLVKNQGKTVADVMTNAPMVVRGNTDLEAAARLLLERRIRRMPVVDSQGRLIGIFSRGDVIRAALTQRKAAVEAGVPAEHL